MGECNPQAENGHVDIANEIAEALARTPLSGNEFRVLFALFRKTYGWHKKQDRISIGQIITLTGLSRRSIIYSLQNLEAKNMVTIRREKEGNINKPNLIAFQKIYTLWVVQNSAQQVKNNRDNSRVCKQNRVVQNTVEVVQNSENYENAGFGSAKLGLGVVQNHKNNLPSFAPTKETKTTKEKNLLFATFTERKDRILEMFPWINFEAEKEKCVHYYREKTLLDPWQVALAWLGKIPKTEPREQAPVISLEEARAAQIADLIEKGVLEPGDYPPAKREGTA
jgi:phage replication O-like protein O